MRRPDVVYRESASTFSTSPYSVALLTEEAQTDSNYVATSANILPNAAPKD
jgi:hypothetical protein